jgi:hypothetical protein
MNRSILIVICDFLLVSLLAFSTVDINKVADVGADRRLDLEMVTNRVEAGQDMSAVLRTALEEERKNRDQLMGELAKSRRVISQRGEELQTKEQESQRLQREQATLQEQYAAAQTNLQALNAQLQGTSAEAVLSNEKLKAMEAEAQKQSELTAGLRDQLDKLSKTHQAVLNEKQQLAGQLQVAEAEKRFANEQVARMQDEVKVEREEKAKLAEGVKVLASRSGELAQEVRENRPLAPNTIFNDFLANRVKASFSASRTGFLGGDSVTRRETQTVLVTDGTNTFALCHVQDTPLSLNYTGTEWEGLTGFLTRGTNQLPIRSLSFYLQDPRLTMIPVTADDAHRLGTKVYRISNSPFKFQDAVLLGAKEGYYGECKFQIDQGAPDYVKLDRNVIKGIFGKFNPSRGDLVFSKMGELLGVMANDSYCIMLRGFDAAATFQFGENVRGQHTGTILSQLYARVADLPFKLQ